MSRRSGLFDLLVSDESSRRAFEETLADWRDEWRHASNPIERVRVSTRGWLSLSRVVMANMRVGFTRPDTWRVFAMALVVSAGLSLLLIPSIWTYSRWPFSPGNFAVAVLLLMPQVVATLLAPASAIGFGAKPGQEPNVIATVAAMVLTMVILAGWAFPATNQMYREFTFSKFAQRSGAALALPQKGITELSAPDLISKARTGWPNERRAALAALSTRLALVISVPVFFVFGIAVRRRVTGRTRWGIARFLAGASAIAVFLTVSFAMSLTLRASPDLAYGDPRGLTVWISSVCLCIATLVLAKTPNQTSEPGTPEPGTQEPI